MKNIKEYKEAIFAFTIVSEDKTEEKTVRLKSVYHRGGMRIMMYSKYDLEFSNIVKKMPGISYSSTNKAWYVNHNLENINLISSVFKGKAQIDASLISDNENSQHKTNIKVGSIPIPLNTETKKGLESFRNWMKQKRYSNKTIETYYDSLIIFFRFFSEKNISEITNDDLIYFNNEYVIKKKLSASYQNQIISAIRLYFKKTQSISFDIDKIERPRRARRLPKVIPKDDIRKMLSGIQNIKHKMALTMIYACGLRRSELISLELDHICSKRRTLTIFNGKGFKDRIIPISDKLMEQIKKYYFLYKPMKYLIEGQPKGTQYGETSLEKIFHKYIDVITRDHNYSLHCLRHSYATHLLESGTDLRYIQTLLGHKSSKTTEIYTWVSMKSLHNIKNPTDDFDL